MSHVAKYDIGLTGAISVDLMATALAAVAAANNGQATRKNARVKNTYGQFTSVEMSLTTKDVPMGIGVEFTPKGPKWVMDSWGKQRQVNSLTAQIKQAYISLAVTTAAKRMGFKSRVKMVNATLSIELDK